VSTTYMILQGEGDP